MSEKYDFEEVVFEALGAASVCWDENKVFESERAKQIGQEVLRVHKQILEQQNQTLKAQLAMAREALDSILDDETDSDIVFDLLFQLRKKLDIKPHAVVDVGVVHEKGMANRGRVRYAADEYLLKDHYDNSIFNGTLIVWPKEQNETN